MPRGGTGQGGRVARAGAARGCTWGDSSRLGRGALAHQAAPTPVKSARRGRSGLPRRSLRHAYVTRAARHTKQVHSGSRGGHGSSRFSATPTRKAWVP